MRLPLISGQNRTLRALISQDPEGKEPKNLLMKVKEESDKASLKLNIKNTKIIASSPITSWQIDGETMGRGTDYFLGLQNHCGC